MGVLLYNTRVIMIISENNATELFAYYTKAVAAGYIVLVYTILFISYYDTNDMVFIFYGLNVVCF